MKCFRVRPIVLAIMMAAVMPLTLGRTAAAAAITDLPASVQGNVILWVEAGTGVTTDASGVASWQNIEGTAGRDLLQSVDSRKPQWTSSVAAVNGKPVVSFDGVNNGTADGLDTTATGIMKGRSQFEMFLVANLDPNSNDFARVLSEEGSGVGNRLFNFGLDNTLPRKIRSIMDMTGATVNHVEPASTTGAYHLYGMRLSTDAGGTLAHDVDGTVFASTGAVGSLTTNVTSVLRLGGAANQNFNNDFARADVAELILFDRPLTDQERNQVGAALEGKYGLTTTYTPPGSVLVDFGRSTETTGTDGGRQWNNVTSVALNTTVATNLIDTDGNATGIDMRFGAGGGDNPGTPAFGVGGWDLTNMTTAGYPVTATEDGIVAYGVGNHVFVESELRGLNPGLLYNLTMYTSASGTRDFVAWEVQGVTQMLSPNAPQNDVVTFHDVRPDANGTISILWRGIDDPIGGKVGSLGNDIEWSVLEITPVVPEPSSAALLALGLMGLAACVRRRKRASAG